MATSPWAIPTGKAITGSTYIKDTDNNIAATIEDLVDWCNNANGTYNDYTSTGLRTDFISVSTAQAITSVKTVDTGGAIDFTNGQLRIGGVAVTSTAAELNLLDGVTSTTAELNILDGVTATAAEINVLDGISPTLTATELSVLDGISPTLTASELSILDGVTATTAELNILDGVTSTAAEINVLDGIPATLTAIEIGHLDGVTSGIQTQLDTITTDITNNINTANGAYVKTALNASGTAPIYACRAWVNFNGVTANGVADLTGVRGSGNVASLVKNSTGNYTITLVTALPDANGVVIATQYDTVTNTSARGCEAYISSTTTIEVLCYAGGGAEVLSDATYVNVSVIR